MRTQRLLRSRNSTPNSVPDSPRSLDSRLNNAKQRPSLNNSPLRPPRGSAVSSAGYESDDSIKFERSNHIAMAQDVMSIKTMLLKLKRVLHEVSGAIFFVFVKMDAFCVVAVSWLTKQNHSLFENIIVFSHAVGFVPLKDCTYFYYFSLSLIIFFYVFKILRT